MYECKACEYKTDRLSNWKKHQNTEKHKSNSKFNKYIDNNGRYKCSYCNKSYKYKSGLSRHVETHTNQKDTLIDYNQTSNKNKDIQTLCSLLQQSLNQNKENLDKLLPKVGNVTNNINELTVNVFLNEQCKGAMNISDFVEKIQLSIKDVQYTGNNGYVKGISNIFAENLSELPATERPIHCCDKQEPVEFYVKDEDKWGKDIQNEKINKTINSVALKQVAAIKLWEEQNPNWATDQELTKEYITIVQQITKGTDNENEINMIQNTISEHTDLSKETSLTLLDNTN